MVFKAFQIGISLNPEKLEQAEQSGQSNQSRSDNKYSSLKLDNDLNTSSNTFSGDLDIPLFPPKKEQDLKYKLLNKCFKDYQ